MVPKTGTVNLRTFQGHCPYHYFSPRRRKFILYNIDDFCRAGGVISAYGFVFMDKRRPLQGISASFYYRKSNRDFYIILLVSYNAGNYNNSAFFQRNVTGKL